jgi:hypothetical protein
MKKISILFLAISTTFATFAQTNKIVLNKNQLLKFAAAIKGNITYEVMGQSVEMLMDITTDRNITVKEVAAKNYQLDAVITRIKMSMNMMGQDTNFDSNNKDDVAGQMKETGKDVNVVKPLTLSVDGKCQLVEKASPEKSETNPMSSMMQEIMGGESDEVTTESYFMLIPYGKKAGDTWTDSIIAGSSKTYWAYTWESTKANIAVIKAIAKATIKTTINMQGMDMAINMANDVVEDRKVNLTNGIITGKISTAKINGTMDVTGLSLPMTGSIATTVTTVE